MMQVVVSNKGAAIYRARVRFQCIRPAPPGRVGSETAAAISGFVTDMQRRRTTPGATTASSSAQQHPPA
jgi:hypothetical protein